MPTPARPHDDEPDDVVLDPKSLSGILDSSPFIRARLRFKEEGRLLRWPKDLKGKEMVGSITMASVAYNVKALTLLAKYWCPQAELKKNVIEGPDIELMRKEARFEQNPHTIHLQSNKIIILQLFFGR